jgi:magnesium chelatase family protein
MYVRLNSTCCEGLNVHPIDLEVSTGKGLPGMVIVGLPGKAIMESKDRVKMALQNSTMPFPRGKITVNLAPGDLKKEGPLFDLPIALGLMICTEFLKVPENINDFMIVGELSLDGICRPIPGILNMAEFAHQQQKHLICPVENYPEANLVEGLSVIPVASLDDLHSFFTGKKDSESLKQEAFGKIPAPPQEMPTRKLDFSDVKGQSAAKRALLISAAGQHNLIMVGPPGSGKSMLAERYSSILPPLMTQEALEVTKIHSVAGLTKPNSPLIQVRPFRSPHHSISEPALIGGGSDARPGEISLCHRGILFLDELPEFKRSTLEVLRQPLESGKISIGRSRRHSEYPAKFTLIAAMNPCPCGYYGSRVRSCRCSSSQTERYLSKLSGPLLDRIDLHIEVTDQSPSVLRKKQTQGVTSSELRVLVTRTHETQNQRYQSEDIQYNGELRGALVERYCHLDTESEDVLLKGMQELGLSTRAFHKVLIVARTIADLDEQENILLDHVCEALNYRLLDKQLFN